MAKENNYEISHISYRKGDGSESERDIIVLGKANENHTTLEVTKLNDIQRNELRSFLLEQKAALSAKLAGLGVEFKSLKPGMITQLDTKAA